MKIEKIKNFNQIMLAIVSVLAVVLITIMIIAFIPELRIFESNNYNYMSNSLMSDENVAALNQDSLHKQIVSYESPLLIDTLNAVYIIPVSVTTLNKPEKSSNDMYEVSVDYSDGLLAVMDTHSKPRKGYYSQKFFQGQYANLIHYQPSTNKTILLFNERIMLNYTQAYYFKDDILLVFKLYEKDTNKDGFIDMEDDNNLGIYSLKTEKMRKISDGENFVSEYQFIENSKDLLVEFSINQYKDVKFKSSHKPKKVMKYEFETEKLSEIVPQEIQIKMQKLLEGK